MKTPDVLLMAMAAMPLNPAFADPPGSQAAGRVGFEASADPSGGLATVNLNGRTNPDNAFFQSLGTNGRSCGSCHIATQAFSMSAAGVRRRFLDTRGADPVFASVDGANCPNVQQGDPAGHSLILRNGLIRVGLPLPANAQFTISVVHDPYNCAIVPGPSGGPQIVSVYRRPLPTTNLVFLS